MKFQFHYKKSLISFLIRVFSNGRFNHTSILLGDTVYEAHIRTGVTKTRLSKWDNSTVVETIEVKLTKTEERRVRTWLNKQVGKKYDIIGIISFLFILLPPRKGYWYCSELGVVSLAKAKGIKGEIENQKISPQMFHNILLY